MNRNDGRIYSTKEVHCAACGQFVGGLGRTLPAEQELRMHYGWSKVRKLGWCCAECARDMANVTPT